MTAPLIVDSFAGGGGASLGIELALGRSPDIAINHDREAIALHAANHPTSRHYAEDVWKVDPVAAVDGRDVLLMWLSPDCKHFSKAKGAAPVSPRVRGLAWVAVRWASAVRPRIIILENVEEFQGWGPVDRRTQRPDPARKGLTFRRFIGRLRGLGYVVEWRELRACDYGAPTTRKRLFVVARCDGRPIVWPRPTHGPGRPAPWRTAAECIDWSIPCPSIFLTPHEARAIGVRRPLAEATMRRIARGLRRFVLDSRRPFIVPVERGVGAATLIQAGYGEREGQAPRVPGLDKPLGTVVAGGVKRAVVAAFLAKHYGGHETPGTTLELPLSTATTIDHHALVASHLVKLRGTARDGSALTAPMPTATAQGNHLAEVRAFLVAYYGNERHGGDLFDPMRTITARDRMGLVVVHGVPYQIVDIGMRMLAPRELYRAQGFPDSYRIDIAYEGKPLSRGAQVRMVGNSVSPMVAAALVRANVGADTIRAREAAA